MTQSVQGNEWSVWRQDDNGNRFLVEDDLTEEKARLLVKKLEATGHKQSYWMEKRQQVT